MNQTNALNQASQAPSSNAMNPLEGLIDIIEPEQFGYFPLAPGWWVVIILVSILLTGLIVKLVKRRQLRKQQRSALAQLNQDELSNEHIVSILKWAALQYFPRKKVASLFGQQFQQFLQQSLPPEKQLSFNDLSANAFNDLYKSPENAVDNFEHNTFKQAAILWVTHALPVNKDKGAIK